MNGLSASCSADWRHQALRCKSRASGTASGESAHSNRLPLRQTCKRITTPGARLDMAAVMSFRRLVIRPSIVRMMSPTSRLARSAGLLAATLVSSRPS